MTRAARARPLVLLAALVPLHAVTQHLLLGRVLPALLAVPVAGVAAFEAMTRYAERRRRTGR